METTPSNFVASLAGFVTACAEKPFKYFFNRASQGQRISYNPRVWYRGLPTYALGRIPVVNVQAAFIRGATNYWELTVDRETTD